MIDASLPYLIDIEVLSISKLHDRHSVKMGAGQFSYPFPRSAVAGVALSSDIRRRSSSELLPDAWTVFGDI